MKKSMKLALFAGAAMVLASGTTALAEETDTSVFGYGEATVDDASMQYRLYDPADNGYEAESYPLVLYLHG